VCAKRKKREREIEVREEGRDHNKIIEHETVSINSEIIARKRYARKRQRVKDREIKKETEKEKDDLRQMFAD
jgi:hypothetical protein